MGELGLEDSRSGRMRLARHMKRRILGIRHADRPWEADEQWRKIRRGWHLGGEAFKSEILTFTDPFSLFRYQYISLE
jgi:hypothetical protein